MREPRPPERIPEFLQALQEAWELYPDMRFGQLVINIAETGVANMYHLEETQWLHKIKTFRKRMAELEEKMADAARES